MQKRVEIVTEKVEEKINEVEKLSEIVDYLENKTTWLYDYLYKVDDQEFEKQLQSFTQELAMSHLEREAIEKLIKLARNQ